MLPDKGMPYFHNFEDNQGAVELAKNPVGNDLKLQAAYLRTFSFSSRAFPLEGHYSNACSL